MMKESAAPMMGNTISSVLLGGLALLVVFATLSGRKIPLLSNDKAALAALVILGMAMCMRGVNRVAATGSWAHPLAIVGYLLGGLILVLAIAVLIGKPLPWVSTARQAVIATAILTAVKLVISTLHRLYF